jgi:hypothetical protein
MLDDAKQMLDSFVGDEWGCSCSSKLSKSHRFLDCYGNRRLILQMQFVDCSWVFPANRNSTASVIDEIHRDFAQRFINLVNWCNKSMMKLFEKWEMREFVQFFFCYGFREEWLWGCDCERMIVREWLWENDRERVIFLLLAFSFFC